MRSVEQVHRQSGVMLQLGFELYGAGRPESAFALGTKCLGNDSHPGFAQCAYQCIRMLPCNLRVAGMHANAILKKNSDVGCQPAIEPSRKGIFG